LLGLLFFQPGHIAIILWGITDFLFKKDAERADAFKSNLIANFPDTYSSIYQQFPGAFDPFSGKVLMRRFMVDPGKEAVKMKARNASFPGYSVQVDGFLKIFIDIPFRFNNFSVDVRWDLHLCNNKAFSNLLIDFQ
jgi:hypothetical protein